MKKIRHIHRSQTIHWEEDLQEAADFQQSGLWPRPLWGGGLSQTALGLVGRYAFPPDSTTSKDGSSQLLSGLHSQRHLSPCRNNCPGRTLVENQSEVALACLLPCRSDVPFIAPAVHHQCHLAATSQIWRDFPLLFVSFSFLISF